MSLAEMLAEGFDILEAEFGKDFTYRQSPEETSYNPVTGASSDTYEDRAVRGILLSFNMREQDLRDIQPQDRKLIIGQDQFGTGFEPKLTDLVCDEDDKEWQIISFKTGVIEEIYTFQLRR